MSRGKIFKRLDRRNKGYGIWSYYVNRPFSGHRNNRSLIDCKQQYYQWREWCWKTWGASKEIENWLEEHVSPIALTVSLECQNPHWCWQNDLYGHRIYLRSDHELSQFLLRWGNP